ncbi:MAG: hypothetical protein Q7S61_02915 [bacterium]|nr:hypothetical protein [bacterium]
MKSQKIFLELTADIFKKTSWNTIQSELKNISSSRWEELGRKKALDLFHKVSKDVPAYKDFLKKNRIKAENVRSYADFIHIPPTDKQNYIDLYPLKDRVWHGTFDKSFLINSSSGSTGRPYFWPLGENEVAEGAMMHELIYREQFESHKKSTLVIITFGMGTWIAGVYTMLCLKLLSEKGYKITLISPGFNKEEVLQILEHVAPQFEQTVIAGIPTFVKDVLDISKTKKNNVSLKLHFAGEGFSETWRSYIMEMIDSSTPEYNTVSVLGSADAGIMAFESSDSILIRRLAAKEKSINTMIFNSDRTPSLTQYIPTIKFFEERNGSLLITANRSVPLIRYAMHDEGGCISSDRMKKFMKGKIRKTNRLGNLPYVYVFGRGKFSAVIYGANIYPEHMREILSHEKIRSLVTGRFEIKTHFDEKTQNQSLHLHIELAEKVNPSSTLNNILTDVFILLTRKMNGEYNRIWQEYGEKVKPVIFFYLYGDPHKFPLGKVKKSS